MDKLQMAMRFAEIMLIEHFKGNGVYNSYGYKDGICEDAWIMADAMQAEADRRKPSGLPEALCEADAFADPFKGLYPLIDWNKYGKGLYHFWAMDENGQAFWHNREPRINGGKWDSCHKYKAPTFNHQGNWQDSLRKRSHDL